MSLRRQLLLVSLLLLSLPWAGCQFIREMEGALRQGQAQALQATAGAVAAVVGERPELIYPQPQRRSAGDEPRPSIYAQPVRQPVILDGYADGWEGIATTRLAGNGDDEDLAVTFQAVTRDENLYLLLRVADPDVTYHNPGLSPEPNGDRLLLRTWQDGRRQEYVIATAAPGTVRARPASRRQRGTDGGGIHGYWQDAAGGYTLELEIPLAYTGGRLGFYVIDAGSRGGGPVTTVGNVTPLETAAPPWLIYSPTALHNALAPFSRQGSRIRVVDNRHWLVADMVGESDRPGRGTETFWLLRLLYRSILAQDDLEPPPTATVPGRVETSEVDAALRGESASQRYRDPREASRTLLFAAAPVRHDGQVIGAVVAGQSGEEYLSLTDQAFSRLLLYSIVALGIGILALLGYASLLSWRIGRLSRAAGDAIGPDGTVLDSFPSSGARDEIGELSRRYAGLLDQVREYNHYLRTLSRKLSHELRTPIAVIQTSLENLEQAGPATGDGEIYLTRAREGLRRLNGILTAMSEANRLEESITNNEPGPVDLVPLVREVFEAYRGIYPRHRLTLRLEPGSAVARCVPELLVQALDKLVENAASFCPEQGEIALALASAGYAWAISVSNEGPALPAELQDHLFDPMVSLRDAGSEGVHLGLGLHIVRLISDFHGGGVQAANLPDGSGVRFTLTLPAVQASQAS
ncbi:MAG: ATP-binding protein [Halioglobus sp.]